MNRRDFEAVLPRYHPAVQIQINPGFLSLGDVEPEYRGWEGYLQFWRDWLPAWGENFSFEPHELLEVGDDRLVALLEGNVRGHHSGIAFERQVAFVWTLDSEARVVLERGYLGWDEALEAVGLRE